MSLCDSVNAPMTKPTLRLRRTLMDVTQTPSTDHGSRCVLRRTGSDVTPVMGLQQLVHSFHFSCCLSFLLH